jgi:hypothetical protein
MHFPGMKIAGIDSDGDRAIIHIDYAIIVKTMDDAEQDTRWYGKGRMEIEDLVIDSDPLQDFPATVTGADIKDNQITYRDEVIIPIDWFGNVGLTLRFEGFDPPLRFIGERMTFDLDGHEKYIEHIPKRPS